MNPHLSRNGGEEQRYEGESSEILIADAIQFIQKSKEKGQPFFVVIWYGSPHEPYSGLPEDLALYDDLPEDFGDKMVTLTSNETGYPVERLQRDVLRERFAEITAMDRSIGQIRENNLIGVEPQIADKLEKRLLEWQQSVLESLMGEDYQ